MAIILDGTTGIDMGDTPVSNASQIEVQNSQVTPFSGFKNLIINGKKVVNQRVLTSTDNAYNQDRWYKVGNNWFQGIEGDNNLVSGKTYTLSWVGAATASYYIGTASSSTINAQTFTSIANGGNFTLTISAGQNLWIKFASDATGSTFSFVQLEEGSIATPFEHRPYGLELSLCHRYYEIGRFFFVSGYNGAGVNFGSSVKFSVIKRVVPTITSINISVSGNVAAGVGTADIQIDSFLIYHTNVIAPSAGQFTDSWTASAEL